MPGCTSMPSVEVAASPECAVLITVTRPSLSIRMYRSSVRSLEFDKSGQPRTQLALFEVGGVFRVASHVRPTHFGCVDCRSNAKCQDKRVGEMITRPPPDTFA